jgi:hypothetical protein
MDFTIHPLSPRSDNSAESRHWQQQCYGIPRDKMLTYLASNLSMTGEDNPVTAKQKLATSMLSDVQELMEHERHDDARQLINRVKFLLNSTLEIVK